ncbi:hypothetical protein MM236_11285 [Belliella sp. DSM 107340]|uniref:DUF1735 domain-containing protein n=1 Tax=Belliella calami TaxID=2923436 RepID=A0ABS9UPN0_9BACT|nr:hypothetical protein [Belliella calami]MCH7398579.1 hypothetical protein [Belliella calami]
MKNINKIFGKGALLVLLISGCTDFVDPVIPYKDFDTGAYLRTIERTSDSFNFFDLPSSNFALILESVDGNDGLNLRSVEIRVRHRRLIPDVGLEYLPEIGDEDRLVLTLSENDFSPNSESRFTRATFSIPAADAITAVGLSEEDIEQGDVFEFRLVLTDNKGRVFSNHNRSSDVAGGNFYASPFFYNVTVVCPSNLDGTFNFTTTNISAGTGGNAGACGGTVSGKVVLEQTSAAQYSLSDASFGVFGCAWNDDPPAGSLRLTDACGLLQFTGTDKYGDPYTITIVSNDGASLTFNWVNAYGDGGTTTLTADDEDFVFPDNLRTN